MATHKALIVEEDDQTRTLLLDRLGEEGFDTQTCCGADDVIDIVRARSIDITLIGVPLRAGDAYQIARRLRHETTSGVIMLGQSDDEVDITLALEMGADDYLVKPIRPRETCARIRTVLRRTVVSPANDDGARPLPDHFLRDVDGIEICGVRRCVSVGGEPVDLTAMEFDVLMVLAANTNAVLSRERIINAVYGGDWSISARAVDGIISRLRRKLFQGEEGARRIRTVHGRGYMLLENL